MNYGVVCGLQEGMEEEKEVRQKGFRKFICTTGKERGFSKQVEVKRMNGHSLK